MPDKASGNTGTSGPKPSPNDQGQSEQRPTNADKDILERAEKALEAVNNAASTVRTLFFYLLLGTYIGIIIGSTTHEQLLRVSPVTLPLLNVQLPITAFYKYTPVATSTCPFQLPAISSSNGAQAAHVPKASWRGVGSGIKGSRERVKNAAGQLPLRATIGGQPSPAYVVVAGHNGHMHHHCLSLRASALGAIPFFAF
jgi:hypothetical protein